MNHQNEPAQLRFLEETAHQLRQNGFTVEPIEDHHLPVSVEKGRLFDGFDETNKQTPERSYKILRKDRSILCPQKGHFSGFCL